MAQSMASLERKLNQRRADLKTLQQKYELNNKKIKLLRKENEELKSKSEKQSQTDTNLLLQSKELSDANTKLQHAIEELEAKLLEPTHDSQPIPDYITIANVTINSDTLEVDLSGKEVGDEEFMEIQPFNKIESLILDNNKLTNSSVSMILSQMKGLRKLLLNSNTFDATALTHATNLGNLKVLQLNNNQLGDSCMEFVCTVSTLMELSVSKNKITDKGVEHLLHLNNLNYLDITNNAVTDEGTKTIIQLKKLTHLYVGWNKLTFLGVRWLIKDLPLLDALDARLNLLNAEEKDKIRAEKGDRLQLFC